MKLAIIQHAEDSGPGHLLEWLKEKKHFHRITRLYEGDPIPKIADFDLNRAQVVLAAL